MPATAHANFATRFTRTAMGSGYIARLVTDTLKARNVTSFTFNCRRWETRYARRIADAIHVGIRSTSSNEKIINAGKPTVEPVKSTRNPATNVI